MVRNDIELRVRASDIPDAIEVDLTGLDVNDVIRISDVTLPEGVRPTITDRDFMIANISAPSALAAEEDEEEGAGDESVEVPTVDEDEAEEPAEE